MVGPTLATAGLPVPIIDVSDVVRSSCFAIVGFDCCS